MGNELFIEKIYQAVNDVLGGNNPDQMLCLTMTETVLTKEIYEYDVKKENPLLIATNESRLVNKMFNVATVSPTYNMNDGTEFYMIYEDYVKEKKKWAEVQNEKKPRYMKNILLTLQKILKNSIKSIWNGIRP